jgi:hypothetical protein
MKNVNFLSPDQPGEFIAAACSKLIDIFKQYPNLKSNLTTHNSVLTIMEMLESANENVVYSILQVVNEVRMNQTTHPKDYSRQPSFPRDIMFDWSFADLYEVCKFRL